MHTPSSTAKPAFKLRSVVVLCVLLLMAIASHCLSSAGGDKRWLLETAHLWLSGKHLYHDIVQPNLPLITWVYAFFLEVSRLLHAEDSYVLVGMTFTLIGWSVVLCHKLLAFHPYFSEHPHRRTHHWVLLLFMLIYIPQSPNFGDREHLMMTLLLPFIIYQLPSLQRERVPNWIKTVVAMMAGLAPGFKPHAVTILGIIVLQRLLRERSLKSLFCYEHLVAGATLCAFFLAMLTFTSDYFTVVMPLLLKTYSAETKGIETLMYYATSIFALMVPLADFRLRYTSPYRRDIYYFFAVIAAGLLYATLNNGWVYTFIPLDSMILMLTVWLGWEYTWLRANGPDDAKIRRSFTFGKTACILSLTVIGLWNFIRMAISFYYAVPCMNVSDDNDCIRIDYPETAQLIRREEAHSFGMLPEDFGLWSYVQHETGALMVTRFNHLFMLPKFIESPPEFANQNRGILEYVANAYAEDMDRFKPDLMLVDAGNDYANRGVKLNFEKYFLSFPKFAESWKHYEFLETMDLCSYSDNVRHRESWCKREIYKRID